MFAKETYVQRRARLKKTIGSGVLLFLGNDEQGLNYEDNTFRYRQDSTFLYYFGLSFAGLSAPVSYTHLFYLRGGQSDVFERKGLFMVGER